MKRKIIKYLKEIITFFIILGVSANLISIYKSRNLNHQPLSIESLKLIDNKSYTFKSTDKPVLIHFWASWCPTCKLEASNIEFLSNYFEVVTIAVKSGSNKEIQDWLSKEGYGYNVVNDNEGAISSHFNIMAFPTTLIYDKDKNLIFSEVGYTSTLGLVLRMLWAGN